MDALGIWPLAHGVGVVVEYAGREGRAQWTDPSPFHGMTQDSKAEAEPARQDEAMEILVIKQRALVARFNLWTLDGEAFSMETMQPMYTLHAGGMAA